MALCIYCKETHASASCPLYLKAQALFKAKSWKLSSEMSTQAPAPFIGHFGYPHVSVGVLSPPEKVDNTWEYDAPRHWAVGNYQIPNIVEFRSALVNSRTSTPIKEVTSKIVQTIQEVAMASRPVDIDIKLSATPHFSVQSDGYSAPVGPSGSLKEVKLTTNPTIPSRVERAVSDTDLLAQDAITSLYSKGMDEHALTKLLSVGALGLGAKRKLVPTKWSITATDDMLGKKVRDEIRDFPMADYRLYIGGYLGNYYLILLFPQSFSYELFESSVRNEGPLSWSTDHETTFGRKEYASETAGGYYACRLAILEKLKAMRKQATVLALRFITNEYTLPLGVWVVREATRKALASDPVILASKGDLLKHAINEVKERFGVNPSSLLGQSKVLQGLSQRSLWSFS